MIYLEYHKEKKQVVEIHETEPTLSEDYDFALSDRFSPGDEFEWTIWINEIDENKNLISYSAIRNNPNAKRLLKENAKLIDDMAATIAYSVDLDFKTTMLELGLL